MNHRKPRHSQGPHIKLGYKAIYQNDAYHIVHNKGSNNLSDMEVQFSKHHLNPYRTAALDKINKFETQSKR